MDATYIFFFAMLLSAAFLLILTLASKIGEASANRMERKRKEQKMLENMDKNIQQMSYDISKIYDEVEKTARQIRITGGH